MSKLWFFGVRCQNREEEPGRQPRIHPGWPPSRGLLWCKKSGTLGLSIRKLLDCSCKKEETNGNSYTSIAKRGITWTVLAAVCSGLRRSCGTHCKSSQKYLSRAQLPPHHNIQRCNIRIRGTSLYVSTTTTDSLKGSLLPFNHLKPTNFVQYPSMTPMRHAAA